MVSGEMTFSDLKSAGVGVDKRQRVYEERDEQQKRVEDGHRLEQKDCSRLRLVLEQDEERSHVAREAEQTDQTNDDRTDDEVVQSTAGFVGVLRRH